MLGPSALWEIDHFAAHRGLASTVSAHQGDRLGSSASPVQVRDAIRGMVFQDYTSFDNRTVLQNVAFGLECAGVHAKEREVAGP